MYMSVNQQTTCNSGFEHIATILHARGRNHVFRITCSGWAVESEVLFLVNDVCMYIVDVILHVHLQDVKKTVQLHTTL